MIKGFIMTSLYILYLTIFKPLHPLLSPSIPTDTFLSPFSLSPTFMPFGVPIFGVVWSNLVLGEPKFNNHCLWKHKSPHCNDPSSPHFPIYIQGVRWLSKNKLLERLWEMQMPFSKTSILAYHFPQAVPEFSAPVSKIPEGGQVLFYNLLK